MLVALLLPAAASPLTRAGDVRADETREEVGRVGDAGEEEEGRRAALLGRGDGGAV